MNGRKDGPAPASERAGAVRPASMAVSGIFLHAIADCSVVENVATVPVSSHTPPARGVGLHASAKFKFEATGTV